MDDFEARILTIELIDTWVVCCYAPATGDDLKRAYRVNTWNPAFGNYLERLKATGKSIILVGDTNIAPRRCDNTLPKDSGPAGFASDEYPCSTEEERESWKRHVVKDWLIDTFAHLYP